MICPNCGKDNNRVLEGVRKRVKNEMLKVYPRRSRLCRACGTIFRTREVYVPDEIRTWKGRKAHVKQAFIKMGVRQ